MGLLSAGGRAVGFLATASISLAGCTSSVESNDQSAPQALTIRVRTHAVVGRADISVFALAPIALTLRGIDARPHVVTLEADGEHTVRLGANEPKHVRVTFGKFGAYALIVDGVKAATIHAIGGGLLR